MIETIAMAAVGLAFAFTVLVVLVVIGAAVFRSIRRPPPLSVPVSRAALNPEDANLDFLRRKFPDPAVVGPMPDLEDLHLNYDDRRDRERKREKIRRKLDGDPAPPPPPNQ